jgi:hypothetical protein
MRPAPGPHATAAQLFRTSLVEQGLLGQWSTKVLLILRGRSSHARFMDSSSQPSTTTQIAVKVELVSETSPALFSRRRGCVNRKYRVYFVGRGAGVRDVAAWWMGSGMCRANLRAPPSPLMTAHSWIGTSAHAATMVAVIEIGGECGVRRSLVGQMCGSNRGSGMTTSVLRPAN